LLFCSIAAFSQAVPIDPRTNPNVTPLDVYVLHPLDLQDAINKVGIAPPNFSRANAGEAEYNIHTCRGVYNMTGSGNLLAATGQANPLTSWIPANEAIGARTVFSDSAIPHWAGAASTSAFGLTGCSDTRDNPSLRPYDSYYSDTGVVQTAMANISCGNVAVNGAPGDTPSGAKGDCIKQEFYTAVMQKVCGVKSRPATPLVGICRIHDFEGVNESDTGQQWGQQSGTWTRLAAQEADEARIVFAYCGDCTYYIGSMACGGKQYSIGGTNGLCDQNMNSLLDQFHIVAPDLANNPRIGISYHDYSDQEVVFPGVGATNAISGDGSGSNTDTTGSYIHRTGFGSSMCTPSNITSTNKHCNYSIIEIRQRMRSVIQSKTWMLPDAPMLETEGGYYFDDQMQDDTRTDSLTGATFTATNQRGYMGQLALITADSQNPLYGTGCGTRGCGPIGSNWYQFDSTGSGGLTLYRSKTTNAYCSPYLKTGDCSVIELHSVACFGIEYIGSSYTNAADCYRSNHQFTNAVGIHPAGQAHATVLGWINNINRFTTHFDDVTGAHAKYNSVWSATALNNDGSTVQFMFDTGYERHTTVSTCYPTKTDLRGNVTTITGGTFVLGTEPVKLSGTCAGAPSDFTIAVTPDTLTMTVGSTATVNVVSTALGTFAATAAVTVAGLPTGVTAAPSSFTLAANGTQAVVLTSAAAATNLQPVPSSPASGTVTMTTAVVGNIPAGFQGLSYTKSKLMAGTRFFASNNARGIADFKGLGNGTLRLVTGDNEVWTPAGAGQTTGQISQSDVDNLAAFLTATGWKCTYGLRFLGNTTSVAVAEATYVASKLGSSLVAFEIGNEPDGTGYTGAGYTASSFATAWRTYALAIQAAVPSAQFVGPSTGVATSAGTYSTAMEAANADLLLWDTSHFYHDGPTTGTIAEMLSFTASDGFFNSMVSGIHTTQATYPDAWVLNETNDIYSGGLDGVSNTFSSALYAIDFNFVVAKSGAVMLNWISGGMGTAPSNPYSVIQDSDGYTYQEQPKYAGLLLFTLATQGNQQASMLSTSITSSGNNVKAYGLQHQDGSQAVVILNESTTNMNMAVTFPAAISSANIITLSDASGLTDKVNTNVLLQGSPLSYTPPVPGAPYTATITSGHAGVYVPANSAVLVSGQGSSVSAVGLWTAVSGSLTHSDSLALTVTAVGGTSLAQQTTYAAHGRKKR
jgi:hypothetical protein